MKNRPKILIEKLKELKKDNFKVGFLGFYHIVQKENRRYLVKGLDKDGSLILQEYK